VIVPQERFQTYSSLVLHLVINARRKLRTVIMILLRYKLMVNAGVETILLTVNMV